MLAIRLTTLPMAADESLSRSTLRLASRAAAGEVAAEQRGRRGRAGAGQGLERKGGGREQAEEAGLDQRHGIDGEQGRDRQVASGQCPDAERGQRPNGQADADAEGGQEGDLDQVEVADQRPLGAQGLEHGD